MRVLDPRDREAQPRCCHAEAHENYPRHRGGRDQGSDAVQAFQRGRGRLIRAGVQSYAITLVVIFEEPNAPTVTATVQ